MLMTQGWLLSVLLALERTGRGDPTSQLCSRATAALGRPGRLGHPPCTWESQKFGVKLGVLAWEVQPLLCALPGAARRARN